jgi:hypothetical protein
MNNVLDYQGYRFFQSSFDPDERGRIIHANDFWVQQLHMGYFMLFFAMMSIMFTKHSRFGFRRKLEKDKIKSKLIFVCCWFFNGFTNT